MQRLLPPSLRRSFTGLEVGLSVLSLSLVVLLAECYWSDPRAAGAQQAAIAGQAGAPTTTVAPGPPQEVDRPQSDERTSSDGTLGEATDPPPATSPPSTTPPGTEAQPGTNPPGSEAQPGSSPPGSSPPSTSPPGSSPPSTSPPNITTTPRTAPPRTSPTPTTRPVPHTSSPRASTGGTSQESGTNPPTKSIPPTSPPDNGTTKDTSRERDSLAPANEAMTTIYFAGPTAPPDAYEFFLGTVELGAKGVAERIAVTNLLETPVEVEMVALEGSDPGDFEVVQDKCTGKTVPRDGHCVVEVVFAPSNSCYRMATLVISGPSGIAYAGLQGTGVDPANPSGCDLAADSQPSETSATTTPPSETSATTTPPSVTATATTVPPSTD